ncbi:hypothetical protein D3OALGA1CA_1264 [Olavius algarvensis associated proteobacterium Delta 3]|nr:hypothetical protein D3OALGA1CA_1264 [Olavius algarvensis associated proteobacterium Delta 3]CAB5102523.1 hypothetical protein D3OALGB2SA_1924 [Olavius algarvensis associated proteobacterium Delta 3]
METVLQSLVGLSCLFLAGLGVRTMFAVKSMFAILAVEPQGAAGLSTIRGFLGGLFIGSSIVLATGLVTDNTTFILAVAMTMSVVVTGRCVGLAMDGFDKKVVFPLVTEIGMVAVFIIAYMNL